MAPLSVHYVAGVLASVAGRKEGSMTFTIRIRGAHTQPIVQDFECHVHGRFADVAPRDIDSVPCPLCGSPSEWRISAPHGSVRLAEVVRGGVAQPDSPMYLSTRELAEGMSRSEWRAKRDKIYEERRHKESKCV